MVLWIKREISEETEAINLSHMISGIGNSLGLISALIFGFFCEKRRISIVKKLKQFNYKNTLVTAYYKYLRICRFWNDRIP